MSTRPTLVQAQTEPATSGLGLQTTSAQAATHTAFATGVLSEMHPDEHLLGLQDGLDYLSGILLLLQEHLQTSSAVREDADALAAVGRHAHERVKTLRAHADALAEDYLQRMRHGPVDPP